MEGITVRPATKEDASYLAWNVLQAARSQHPRGMFDYAFADDDEATVLSILTDFITDDSDAGKGSFTHWQGFFVAQTADGTPVAGLTGFPYKERPTSNFFTLLTSVLQKRGWDEVAFGKLHTRMQAIMSCMVTMSDMDEYWIVELVATKPEFRRRGINNLLMQTALNKGRELGFKKAQITVLSDNEAAIKSYERVGFREYNTITSPTFPQASNSPGIMNMRMEL